MYGFSASRMPTDKGSKHQSRRATESALALEPAASSEKGKEGLARDSSNSNSNSSDSEDDDHLPALPFDESRFNEQ